MIARLAHAGTRPRRKTNAPNRQRRAESGFVLIAMLACVLALFGVFGLVFDLGRTLVAKDEAQAFTDAAALGAAARLNESPQGLNAAQAYVDNSANRWTFGTASFSSVTTEYSVDKEHWYNSANAPVDSTFVRVIAPSNSVAMTFLRVLGLPATLTVAARTVAGRTVGDTFGEGVFPFAPIAHEPTAPDFGYTPGDELTLLWPSSVNSDGQSVNRNNLCQSDRQDPKYLEAVQLGTSAERGYIQETSASAIAAAIEDDHMNYTVTLGQPVSLTGGVKTNDVYQSLNARVDQDTDPTHSNYNAYMTGHENSPLRRVVVVPIIADHQNTTVLGFVRVFLPPNQPHNPNNSKCAMYIGPASKPTGNTGSGGNFFRIVE